MSEAPDYICLGEKGFRAGIGSSFLLNVVLITILINELNYFLRQCFDSRLSQVYVAC